VSGRERWRRRHPVWFVLLGELASSDRAARAAVTLTQRDAASSWTVTLAAGSGGQWQVTGVAGT
jgi:hypothetical protein